MCGTCGCSAEASTTLAHHPQTPDGSQKVRRTLTVSESILSKNNQQALHNRQHFEAHGMLVLNLLSSPGAGKTALLERTLGDLGDRLSAAVIVGDLATDNDAERLRRVGATAIPITTGTVCHLEADMVARAMTALPHDGLQLLFIENVGNLVCPAAYDLGEHLRVVLMSVTEGEDKPLKYPATFKKADVVLLTKIEIADAVGCDRPLARHNIQQVAPQATLLEVSARTGEGMDAWYAYLTRHLQALVPPASNPAHPQLSHSH